MTSRLHAAGRHELLVLSAAVLAFGYYLYVLSAGSGGVFAPVPAGLNFNSMLDHMLRGEFDVDPAIIGAEGFRRDGRIYSYFGPYSAFLRLPLVPLGLLPSLDVTRLSCAVALSVVVWAKLRTLLLIYLAAPAPADVRGMTLCVGLATVFGGLQVQLLQAFLFNEPTAWAYAFCSLYIWVFLRALLRNGQVASGDYAWLAVCAGLALAARVSAGLALYVATAVLMLAQFWPALRAGDVAASIRTVRSWLPSLGILLIAFLAMGYVNYKRWGNPLEFAPLRTQVLNDMDPRRIRVEDTYGNFNFIRVPLNFQYYFFPIWLLKSNGQFLLQEQFSRLLIAAEQRPVAVPISDPALVFLIGVWLVQARRLIAWAALPRLPVIAVLAGLSSGAVVVLAASAVASRYRSELYPVMDLAAWIGLYMIFRRQELRRVCAPWVCALALIGIITAHVFTTFYMGGHYESAEREWDAPTVAHALFWDLAAALRRLGVITP